MVDDLPWGSGEEIPLPPSPDTIEDTNLPTLPAVESTLVDPLRPARNLVLTDMRSPKQNSMAGKRLDLMLRRLSVLGFRHGQVFENIDVMKVQIQMDAVYLNADMLLIGSPANYDPQHNVIDHRNNWTTSSLTTAVFYSLQWACRNKKTIVAMTYSANECGRLEWWQDREASNTNRGFLVLPALFDLYRPRRGLQDNLDQLGDGDDIMLALSLPVERLPDIKRTRCGKIDGSATLGTFLLSGPTYTFGAFVGELEVDIAEAAARLSQQDVSEATPTPLGVRSKSRSRSPYGCLSERMKSASL